MRLIPLTSARDSNHYPNAYMILHDKSWIFPRLMMFMPSAKSRISEFYALKRWGGGGGAGGGEGWGGRWRGRGGGCPWPSDGRLKDLNILKSFSFLDAKKTGLMKTFKTN